MFAVNAIINEINMWNILFKRLWFGSFLNSVLIEYYVYNMQYTLLVVE